MLRSILTDLEKLKVYQLPKQESAKIFDIMEDLKIIAALYEGVEKLSRLPMRSPHAREDIYNELYGKLEKAKNHLREGSHLISHLDEMMSYAEQQKNSFVGKPIVIQTHSLFTTIKRDHEHSNMCDYIRDDYTP